MPKHVSPNEHDMLLWVKNRRLAVCGLTSMTLRYHVQNPSPLPERRSGNRLAADLATWSGTGQHFAEYWGQVNGEAMLHPDAAQLLTIHNAVDGCQIALLDAVSQLGWHHNAISFPCIAWSASSPQVLISEVESVGHARSPAALVQLDGSHTSLKLKVPFLSNEVDWSPCSRFFHSVQHSNHDIDGFFSERLTIEGHIWDAATDKHVFAWHGGRAFYQANNIVWSPVGCMCLVLACKTIVALPAEGVRDEVVCLPWNGPPSPDDNDGVEGPTRFCFSPCEKLIVGEGQLSTPRAFWDAMGSS